MIRVACQALPLLRACRRSILLLVLLVLVACAPRPVERPREGAQPVVGGPAIRIENAVPPTLAPAESLVASATSTPSQDPLASPSPEVVASPLASPGAFPIISALQPAPGASLPPGDVVVGARVTGSSNLTDVTFYVDGEPVSVNLDGPPARVKSVSLVRTFAAGPHELRIQARDEHNQLGGYRWQFTVGAARQPTISAPSKPAAPGEPTATPFVVPTRRPTGAPAKPSAPTPASKPTTQPRQ